MKPTNKIDEQMVERAKTLKAIGKTNVAIAKELGVHERTIRRWLERDDPDEIADELAELRKQHLKRFVDDSWEEIHILSEKEKEASKRIEIKTATDLKAIATTKAINIDKITLVEQSGKKKEGGTRININILPPDGYSGNSPYPVADSVQVYDLEGEVLGDNIGPGPREDLYRLPPGCDDSDAVPGEPGLHSGEHVQEP